MENLAVHRVIEQHAARHGELPAVVDAARTLSYRELNHAANGVARALMDRGVRRGTHLLVNMPEGCELAVVLLAILKLGGSYSWQRPFTPGLPWRLAIASAAGDARDGCTPVDVDDVLQRPVRPSPNLPVVTRPSDIACVLRGSDRPVLVPHATLLSPRQDRRDIVQEWEDDATTLSLWSALVAGATMHIAVPSPLPHAA